MIYAYALSIYSQRKKASAVAGYSAFIPSGSTGMMMSDGSTFYVLQ